MPHRSMGPRGLRWLATVLIGLSLVVSVGLWAVGAWPVIGFTGLEVAAAVWLVRRHALGPLGTEMLLLSESGLLIVRVDAEGRRTEHALPSSWLRADWEERAGRVPALVLRGAGGLQMEVAQSLGEEEKLALAQTLRAALDRQRRPSFDNPQLREVSPRPDPST